MIRVDVPSKKKPSFDINPKFRKYLKKHNREVALPVQYEDLLRYNISIPLMDMKGEDTLWETVYYNETDANELLEGLTQIYVILKADGDTDIMKHLSVARIDFCTFGNSRPFRIRIINRLNDNYDHFYIKRADASRVYGLELEDLLSPNRIIFLVDGQTLIEEHVAGIPGDDFMNHHLGVSDLNQIRIVKEFIKFNERCFVRLLGDMRSYNYVVDITPDIEGNQYRLRAIDFDQQSYEGSFSFYLPQYFKENRPVIDIGLGQMAQETVRQYQLEERSLIANRVNSSRVRYEELTKIMMGDTLSYPRKVKQLREQLTKHHGTDVFMECTTMGEIVYTNIELVLRREFKQGIRNQA